MNRTVFIFDLDGTLYEDTHHFEFYANRLKDKLPKEQQASFISEYHQVVEGKHNLQIGRVYDATRDLILVHLNKLVKEAYTWSGAQLPASEVIKIYKEPIAVGFGDMVSVGDLWRVPFSIARHYGLSSDKTIQAFLETRSYMMSDDFEMTIVLGLKESLEQLRESGARLTLLTNSPQKDSEVILTKLGLEKVFDKKIFEGKKPSLTKNRFQEIKNDFNVDYHQIVSIGDNWINEILPAQELGCKTIYIDTHQIGNTTFADNVIKSISEVIPLLKLYSK